MTPPASVTSRTGSRRTPSSQGGVTLFARRLSLLALLTVVVAGGAGATTSAALPSPALEAKVVSIQRPTAIVAYPTTDYGRKTTPTDDRAGSTTWRVVQ